MNEIERRELKEMLKGHHESVITTVHNISNQYRKDIDLLHDKANRNALAIEKIDGKHETLKTAFVQQVEFCKGQRKEDRDTKTNLPTSGIAAKAYPLQGKIKFITEICTMLLVGSAIVFWAVKLTMLVIKGL